MKAYLVILLLAGCCGTLGWMAWQINRIVHEFRREVDAAVSLICSHLPPAPDYTPIIEAINGLTVVHQYQGTQGAAPGLLANVEIIRKSPDGYVHVGWRTPGSADISEALTHPDLAIRQPDGTIQGAM